MKKWVSLKLKPSSESPQSLTGLRWFTITNTNTPAACQRQSNPPWRMMKILGLKYFLNFFNIQCWHSVITSIHGDKILTETKRNDRQQKDLQQIQIVRVINWKLYSKHAYACSWHSVLLSRFCLLGGFIHSNSTPTPISGVNCSYPLQASLQEFPRKLTWTLHPLPGG